MSILSVGSASYHSTEHVEKVSQPLRVIRMQYSSHAEPVNTKPTSPPIFLKPQNIPLSLAPSSSSRYIPIHRLSVSSLALSQNPSVE